MDNKIEKCFFEYFKNYSTENNKYLFVKDSFETKDIYREGNTKDTSLHLDLLPQPFIGDLKNAKIIICSLNPGFSDKDRYIEDEESAKESGYKYHGDELKNQLNPEEKNKTLFWLTEEKSDEVKNLSGGAEWWQKKLDQKGGKSFVEEIQKRYQKENIELSKQEVFKMLSNIMAAVELFPYHSKSFKESVLKDCESTKKIREYVHKVLIKEAKEGKRLVCFTRSFLLWSKGYESVSEIAENNQYVICSKNPRCVTFNFQLPFGEQIINYLKDITGEFKKTYNIKTHKFDKPKSKNIYYFN